MFATYSSIIFILRSCGVNIHLKFNIKIGSRWPIAIVDMKAASQAVDFFNR